MPPFNFNLNKYPVDYAYPDMLPNTNGNGYCSVRLTPDDTDGTDVGYATSFFQSFSFGNGNPTMLFSMTAGYRIYGDNNGSADGLTFVMHQDVRGISAVGGVGASMGVYYARTDDTRSDAQISPALVIELDTCKCVSGIRMFNFVFRN